MAHLTFKQYVDEQDCMLNWEELLIWMESATSVLPYKKLANTSTNVRYGFVFNDDPYVVDFDYSNTSDNLRICVLTFYIPTEQGHKEYGTLNKGKYAGPCFGTLVDIVKQEKSNWDVLCYIGMGESRVGVYRYLFKKNADRLFYYQQPMTSGMIFVISKQQIPQHVLTTLTNTADRIISAKSEQQG